MVTWISDKLLGIRRLLSAGVELPERGAINFVGGGVTVTDDPTNKRTEVSIATGAGGLTNVTGTSPVAITTPSAGVRNVDVSGLLTSTAPVTIQPDDAASAGTGTTAARHDHRHAIAAAAPTTIGTSNTEGSSTSFARADHVHDHGAQAGGATHAVAGGGVAGFISGASQAKLDVLTLPILQINPGAYAANDGDVILADTSAGDSVTLPADVSTYSRGVWVIGIPSGTGCVVTANGSDTILGAGTNNVNAGQAKLYRGTGIGIWAVLTGAC